MFAEEFFPLDQRNKLSEKKAWIITKQKGLILIPKMGSSKNSSKLIVFGFWEERLQVNFPIHLTDVRFSHLFEFCE